MLSNDKDIKQCIVDIDMLPQSMLLTLQVKERLKHERVTIKQACDDVGLPLSTYKKWKNHIQLFKKI